MAVAAENNAQSEVDSGDVVTETNYALSGGSSEAFLLAMSGNETGSAVSVDGGAVHGSDALSLLNDGVDDANVSQVSTTGNYGEMWGRKAASDQTADLTMDWSGGVTSLGMFGDWLSGADVSGDADAVGLIEKVNTVTSSPCNITIDVTGLGAGIVIGFWVCGNPATNTESDEADAGFTVVDSVSPTSSQVTWGYLIVEAGDEELVVGIKTTGSWFRCPGMAVFIPAVSAGDVLISGLTGAAVAGKAEPTAVLGSLSLTELAEAVAGKVDPAVILGSLSFTEIAAAVAGKADPGVVLGSLSLSEAAEAVAGVLDPSILLGSTSASGAAAEAVAGVAQPVVILGSLSLVALVAEAVAARAGPSVVLGPVAVTPEAEAVAGTLDPTPVLGAILVSGPVASAVAGTLDPTIPAGVLVSGVLAEAFVDTGAVVIGGLSDEAGEGRQLIRIIRRK